jgi:glyceraldehyde 3-phosphate dehydrogenase
MVHGHELLEVVAINDLGNLENLAYLLTYDTAYGRSPFSVEVKDGALIVDGRSITVTSIKEPSELAWGKQGVAIVVESTGVFTSYEKSQVHIDAGAKRVVITGPVKEEAGGATVLMGMNTDALTTCTISSNASCTTNATSPLIGILEEAIGIERAVLSTTHAYTASQLLVDGPSKKDLREGRAAAQNIVPSSTGAAIATTLVHESLRGKFDGISLRVPVQVGSIVDVTFVARRPTTVSEVNEALSKAAGSDRWKNLFAVTNEPLVSSDIIGARYASIADLEMTRVVDGTLVKVLAWYDNETSYTQTLVDHVAHVAKLLQGE